MLSKTDIRDSVHFMLRQQADATLYRKNPDVYHGWVPPQTDPNTGKVTPGHWLGAADEELADQRLQLAKIAYKDADQATWGNDDPALAKAAKLAEAKVQAAEQRLAEAREHRERLVDGRREQLLNRKIARLFLRAYRESLNLDWDLYNPSVPESLRRYVQRQLSRPLGPTSRVYLYLLVKDTIQHGEDFQTESLTAYNHLADNPLAVASLDIDVADDEPSRQRRAYVRELQAQAIRDRQPPAHANLDPRDVLADFEYHGLPEQLGAMWITKDGPECCPNCKQQTKVRMVHAGTGFRWADVCPNYRTNKNCRYDVKSPVLESRKALRDWAAVEVATAAAA